MTYRAPVSDMLATMRHVASLDRLIADGLAPELEGGVTEAVLDEAAKFAADVIAPLNRVGDAQGSKLKDGAVTTPPGWKEAYKAWAEAGWNALPAPEAYGGQGLPTLLADLEQRGMLDTTLVVWLTDFGRTPQINAASGRDHWATAASVVMAGVGVPGGSVVGRTDAEGGQPIDSPYYPEDVAATIYAKLGIPLDLMLRTPDGRPIRMNEGQPIREWM